MSGAYSSVAAGPLLERKTRFVVLCRVNGCTAQDAPEGSTRQVQKLPTFPHESQASDRRNAIACHAELATRLNIATWFAATWISPRSITGRFGE